jgi:ubiquitin C-terminal hydrolase
LTIEYTKLLIEIFFPKGKKKSFPPFDFKQILGNQESMFGSNEAEDAKDLYLFLIETMNNELNGGIPAIYNDILRLKIDPKDQKKIKETFMNEFNRKNNTPFSNYLYGFSQTCSICSLCHSKLYNFECFNVLSFPLLDVKNYINQNSNNNNNNQYTLNLNDCFLYYLKTENYNGENKLYCQACNSNQDSSLERIIDSTPKILVIILDRGQDNLDFTENFKYDEELDLTPFVSKDSINQYYLCGVITHLGESGPTGHFIAYCRMAHYSAWYLYNDSQVSKINDSQEIFNGGNPYILFYHYYG